MNTCAVTIPVYKKEFTTQEVKNVETSISNLNDFNIYIFAPESLDTHFYESRLGLNKVVRFPDTYFDSVQGYSRLLLTDTFYKAFETYSHLLICQPDAMALKPELGHWIDQPYDYIGAPWTNGWELIIYPKEIEIPEGIKCRAFIGNGGFSLRNIDSCLKLFNEFESLRQEWVQYGHAEDLFFGFASILSKRFRTPNLMVAACFSHETEPEYFYKLIGNQLPFGCHAHDLNSPKHWDNLLHHIDLNLTK